MHHNELWELGASESTGDLHIWTPCCWTDADGHIKVCSPSWLLIILLSTLKLIDFTILPLRLFYLFIDFTVLSPVLIGLTFPWRDKNSTWMGSEGSGIQTALYIKQICTKMQIDMRGPLIHFYLIKTTFLELFLKLDKCISCPCCINFSKWKASTGFTVQLCLLKTHLYGFAWNIITAWIMFTIGMIFPGYEVLCSCNKNTKSEEVVGVGGGFTKYKTWMLETGVPHVVRFSQQKHW